MSYGCDDKVVLVVKEARQFQDLMASDVCHSSMSSRARQVIDINLQSGSESSALVG